jgi:hypothetical protein
MIFGINEVDAVNFDAVLETSAETLRLSVDGTKTFVKWEGEMPECVSILGTKEGPYSHSEILEILSGEDWTAPMEEI